MSAHYTRDFVWVVHTSLSSLSVPYAKLKALGVNGVYLNAADPLATDVKRREVVGNGFKCGLFYPASSEYQFGADVANLVSAELAAFAKTENDVGGPGQTPVLCDFEPTSGSAVFWDDFLNRYRTLRPGRVTDFTTEPFKAGDLDPGRLITLGKMDVKVQAYFGDMSPVDAAEAVADFLDRGVERGAVRTFVDGGRVIKPPIFYQGQIVRKLRNGTCIWNTNLLREAGLV